MSSAAFAGEPAAITIESSTVSPQPVIGGDSAVQTITLTAPAPAGGLDIGLYVHGDSVYGASVDNHAFIPAGQTTVTFPVRFEPKAQQEVIRLRAQVPDEVDHDPRQKFIADVTVVPADPAQRAVTAFDVKENGNKVTAALDGTELTGTVGLKSPAPAGGVTVALRDTRTQLYTVVPQGRTTVDTPITVRTAVPEIRRPLADLGTSRAGDQLVVVPRRFALPNTSYAGPGVTFLMPIGIGTRLAPAGATIKLSSDNPGVTVPNELKLAAWMPGGAFPVAVSPAVPVGTKVTLTATWRFQTITTTVEIFGRGAARG